MKNSCEMKKGVKDSFSQLGNSCRKLSVYCTDVGEVNMHECFLLRVRSTNHKAAEVLRSIQQCC